MVLALNFQWKRWVKVEHDTENCKLLAHEPPKSSKQKATRWLLCFYRQACYEKLRKTRNVFAWQVRESESLQKGENWEHKTLDYWCCLSFQFHFSLLLTRILDLLQENTFFAKKHEDSSVNEEFSDGYFIDFHKKWNQRAPDVADSFVEDNKNIILLFSVLFYLTF